MNKDFVSFNCPNNLNIGVEKMLDLVAELPKGKYLQILQ